jgi:hypothetical protein
MSEKYFIEVELYDNNEPDGMMVVRSLFDLYRMFDALEEMGVPDNYLPYLKFYEEPEDG